MDTNLYAMFFELAVNRSQGTQHKGQWVQPKGTHLITGVYFHALPYHLAYADGYRGWFRIHSSVYDKIAGNHPLKTGIAIAPPPPKAPEPAMIPIAKAPEPAMLPMATTLPSRYTASASSSSTATTTEAQIPEGRKALKRIPGNYVVEPKEKKTRRG